MWLVERIRLYGPVYACALCLTRLIPRQLFRFRWHRIYERCLQQAGESGVGQANVAWATSADLERFDEIAIGLTGRTEGAGEFCVCRDNGRLIGCLGVSWSNNLDQEIGCLFETSRSAVWLFQGVVTSSHRGRNVFAQMLRLVSERCLEQNRPKQFFSIARFNRPSERSNRDAQIIGGGVCLRILGLACGVAWGDDIINERMFTWNVRRAPLHVKIL